APAALAPGTPRGPAHRRRRRPARAVSERVLITGANGLIGGILRRALSDYDVTGLDVRPRRLARGRSRDLTKLAAVLPAFQQREVVVDLAADPRPTADWRAVHGNNLLATHSAFE